MPPSRNLGVGNASCGGRHDSDPVAALIVAPGARKEKLRQRDFPRRAEARAAPWAATLRRAARGVGLLVPRRRVAAGGPRRGGRAPRDPGRRARRPQRRLRRAAVLEGGEGGGGEGARGGGGDVSEGGKGDPDRTESQGRPLRPPVLESLTLLVENRTGYRNLCRLLTAGALGKPKGETAVTLEQVAAHAEGLHVLTGGDESAGGARARARAGLDAARRAARALARDLPGARSTSSCSGIACARRSSATRRSSTSRGALRLPLLATNGVRYARREGQGAPRRPHVHPPPHARSTRRGPAARRRSASGTSRAPPRWRSSSRTCPRRSTRAVELSRAPRLHARGPRLPFPGLPAAAGRDAVLVPAPGHLERRARRASGR